MSGVDYFLLCKKKYYEMYLNMNNIVEALDEIHDEYPDAFYSAEFSVVKAREYARQFKEHSESCQRIAQQMCSHNFENDDIDIHAERSQSIKYCTICEYSK